jgi:hypothetical protein
MNYLNLFEDSGCIETSFDPESRAGIAIMTQAPSDAMSPLDLLIAAEEWLMEEHGLTFVQAVAQSVQAKPRRPILRLNKPRRH